MPKAGLIEDKLIVIEKINSLLKDGFDKVIYLGADTIVCGRMDEFIDFNNYDIACTLDYNYVPIIAGLNEIGVPCLNEVFIPNGLLINPDVTCFKDQSVLDEMFVDLINFTSEYLEMASLNRVVHRRRHITYLPETVKDVYYNNRAKVKYYEDNNKSMHGCIINANSLFIERKQIKVYHIGDGLGVKVAKKLNTLKGAYKEHFNSYFDKEHLEYFNVVSKGKFGEIMS